LVYLFCSLKKVLVTMTVNDVEEVYGARMVPTPDLIATIIGRKNVANFMEATNNFTTAPTNLNLSPSVKKKAIALLELSRRGTNAIETRKRIEGSKCAVGILKQYLCGFSEEHFFALALNRANKVIARIHISSGGSAGTVVDVKVLMRKLLEAKASGCIISHNHPSGSTRPSDADIQLTEKIKSACSLMDITLLDHIIIVDKEIGNEYDYSQVDFYSFADEGML